MKPKTRVQDVVTLARRIPQLVEEALVRARSDSHAGLPSGHGDGRGTANDGGGAYSRTEMLAVSGQVSGDDVNKRVGRLVELLARTHRAAESLLALPEKERQKLLLPPGAGFCANPHCGRWVPGGPDRLRGGRCDACRKYLTRTGGERRPHDLGRDENDTP